MDCVFAEQLHRETAEDDFDRHPCHDTMNLTSKSRLSAASLCAGTQRYNAQSGRHGSGGSDTEMIGQFARRMPLDVPRPAPVLLALPQMSPRIVDDEGQPRSLVIHLPGVAPADCAQ